MDKSLVIFVIFILLLLVYYFVIPKLSSFNNENVIEDNNNEDINNEDINNEDEIKEDFEDIYDDKLVSKLGGFCDNLIDKTTGIKDQYCTNKTTTSPPGFFKLNKKYIQFTGGFPIRPLKNSLIRPNFNLPKNFTIGFKINLGSKSSKWTNLLRFSDVKSKGDCCQFGQRIFGIWLPPNSSSLHIRLDTDKQVSQGIDRTKFQLPLNKWTEVQITVAGNWLHCSFNNNLPESAFIRGNRKATITNLYTSDPHYATVKCLLTNYYLIPQSPLLETTTPITRPLPIIQKPIIKKPVIKKPVINKPVIRRPVIGSQTGTIRR